AARVAPGTVLELFTEDCFAGRVRGTGDLVSRVIEFPSLNPPTGPFHVEGAEPGDTLAVHFVSIEPARDWAASTAVPLFGALTSTHLTATLQEPLPEVVWIWELDRGKRVCRFAARFGDFTVDLPMDPMHGTVGVAPANLEVRSALVPDAHGGNMDTPEMRAGVTCYLGVNVPGALVSQAVEAPLANVVDTNYTSVAKIRKDWLPGGTPMGGIHEMLREQAAAYLATR